MADLSAIFQSMGMGGGQAPAQDPQAPNPLETMMNPQAGAPPQDPNVPQAPTAIPGVEDPYQAKLAEIETQRKALMQSLAKAKEVLNLDPEQALPEALKTFDTYNEAQYQQTYGGGGVLGTAGRALANVLSGAVNGGKTIKDTLTQQNLKKYQEAVSAANAQTQAQKAAAGQAAQASLQQLTDLNQQQQALNEQRKLSQVDTGLGIKADSTPEARDKVEQKKREDIIQHYKDSGEPLSTEAEKYVRINGKLPPPVKESDAPFAVAKAKIEDEIHRKLTSDEILRLNQHIRFNPYDITREQLQMNKDGTFVAIPVTAHKSEPPPVLQGGGVPKPVSSGGGGGGVRDTGVQGNVQIPAQIQENISGINTSLKLANQILPKLNDPKFMEKASLGPGWGHLTVAEWQKAGGLGVTKEGNDLLNDMQRLTSSEAFINGGKQLTETELRQFTKLLPQPTDTLDKAVTQTKKAIEFLQTKKKARAETLTPAQRKVFEDSGALDTVKPTTLEERRKKYNY